MKNPALLSVLIAGIYPLVGWAVIVGTRLYKSITVLKIYTRQICVELKIPCGKDLD